MPENKEIKCPFRQDEHGEFKACYKEKCMAYFDLKPYSLQSDAPESPCCRKLVGAGPFYPAGCAI